MRTDDEIIDKMAEVKAYDWLGTIRSDLVRFLPFDRAKNFLVDTVKPEDWTPEPRTTEHITKVMLNYMPFAWNKANNCRGISASRSLNHYEAWLWLLGDPLANKLRNYEHYGKEKLIAICEKYGWDWKQWDDGERVN